MTTDTNEPRTACDCGSQHFVFRQTLTYYAEHRALCINPAEDVIDSVTCCACGRDWSPADFGGDIVHLS